jgi:hypothetical protein
LPRARLVSLIRGGNMLTASQDAYGEGVAGLARVGPLGPGPGVSRLVEVKFRDPVTRGDSVVVAPAGEGAAALRLAAAYRPPLGALGARLDQAGGTWPPRPPSGG